MIEKHFKKIVFSVEITKPINITKIKCVSILIGREEKKKHYFTLAFI